MILNLGALNFDISYWTFEIFNAPQDERLKFKALIENQNFLTMNVLNLVFFILCAFIDIFN